MLILATFANRKWDPENSTELVVAWDEFSVEGNPDGYDQERDKALASWGDDLLRWVEVEIEVPMDEVDKVLGGTLRVAAAKVTTTPAHDPAEVPAEVPGTAGGG